LEVRCSSFAAPAAEAAPPEPFTITETIDFNSEEPPTFEATGALCRPAPLRTN
jgi:hypothetical protein